jgi:hypothetical protein
MSRNFGVPRHPYQPVRGCLWRLVVLALAIGFWILFGIFVSHAQPVTCNQQGCSDWHKPAKQKKRIVRAAIDGNSISLAGIVAPLKAKAQEIVRACGSKVVSAYRPGARIPSGQLSNHARHRAVDLRGNPSCIYARLRGWPGGVSIDYPRAPGGPHVHVSYNRNMEWRARFVHRHTRTYHARAE